MSIVQINNTVVITERNRYGRDEDKVFVFDNDRIAEKVASACKDEVKEVGEINLPLLRHQLKKAKIGFTQQ